MPSKTAKKKRPAKKQLSEAQLRRLERLEDLVMDAEDAQDDVREALTSVRRLLRSAPRSARGGLQRSLQDPLESAEFAFMDLISMLRDQFDKEASRGQ